ncbi:MAG: sulfurtransferase TusA family protein [Candidatus Omnitrophica bacterium]|nr:sulfurtransferase TusA family protein [Candidatus Omnitrophota bacterium]
MKNNILKLDITKDNCPITFVKAKLFMENLKKGEKTEILLTEGEPLENLPKALEEQGYKVLNINYVKDNIYKLLVEK